MPFKDFEDFGAEIAKSLDASAQMPPDALDRMITPQPPTDVAPAPLPSSAPAPLPSSAPAPDVAPQGDPLGEMLTGAGFGQAPTGSVASELTRGVEAGVELDKQIFRAVRDKPGEVAQGIVQTFGDAVTNPPSAQQVGSAAGRFADEFKAHPAFVAGELLVGFIPSLLFGGPVGALAKKGLERIVKKSLSLPARAAGVGAVVTAGTAAGGTAGVIQSALIATAQGRPAATPEESWFAGGVGAAFSGIRINSVAKSAGTKVVKEIKDFVKTEYPAPFAAARFPVQYFERLGGDVSKGGRLTQLQRVAQRSRELSRATKKLANDVGAFVGELRGPLKGLSRADRKGLLDALRQTDENWFASRDKGQPLSISDKDLFEQFGLSPKGVAAYNKLLDEGVESQRLLHEIQVKQGLTKGVFKPQRGLLPHRWRHPNRVLVFDDKGNVSEVRDFRFRKSAADFEKESGGLLLNQNQVTNATLDEAIQAIDTRRLRIKATKAAKDGIDDPVKILLEEIDSLRGSQLSRLRAMSKERGGARGYSSLDSIDSLIAAMKQDRSSILSARDVSPLITGKGGAQDMVSTLEKNKVDSGVASLVLKNQIDQVTGAARLGRPARIVKSAAFHSVLGTFNVMVPFFNLVGNTAFLGPQLRREIARFGGDAPGLLKAYAVSLEAFAAMFPERFRHSFAGFTPDLERRIAANRASGAVPTAKGTALPDVNARASANTPVGRIFNRLSAANSWGMRHSEEISRRGLGVVFRRAGEKMGLAGDELETFVSSGVDKVAGSFEKGARAQVLEGGNAITDTTAVALTFQSYIWQKFLVDAPDLARNDPATFIGLLGSVWAIGGTLGIPGLTPMMDFLVDTVDTRLNGASQFLQPTGVEQTSAGSLRADWERLKLENPLINKGPINDATIRNFGVDPSSRTAGAFPLGVGSPFGVNLGGIVGSKVGQAQRAFSENRVLDATVNTATPGDISRRVEGVRSLIAGDRFSPSTASSKKPSFDVSTKGKLATILSGLPPVEQTRQREINSANRAVDTARKDAIHAIKLDAVNTLVRGKLDAKQLHSLRNELTRQLLLADRAFYSQAKNRRAFFKSVDRQVDSKLSGSLRLSKRAKQIIRAANRL